MLYCVICGQKTPKQRVHRFPTKRYYKSKWVAACSLASIPRNSGVCQDHFRDDAYHWGSHRALLKRGAIPEKNLTATSGANISIGDVKEEVQAVVDPEKLPDTMPHSHGSHCSWVGANRRGAGANRRGAGANRRGAGANVPRQPENVQWMVRGGGGGATHRHGSGEERQAAANIWAILVTCLGDSHVSPRHLPTPQRFNWLDKKLDIQWNQSPPLQLCRPGLGGGSMADWDGLLTTALVIRPAPSGFLVSLGTNALATLVDDGTEGPLSSCLAVMRAGLARLLDTLRVVFPSSAVLVMTPVPRLALSEFHRRAFAIASEMFAEVTTSCGGLVLAVPELVAAAPLGDSGIVKHESGVLPPAAFDDDGVHLSSVAGAALAHAVRDAILWTFPAGLARPVTNRH